MIRRVRKFATRALHSGAQRTEQLLGEDAWSRRSKRIGRRRRTLIVELRPSERTKPWIENASTIERRVT